MGTNKRIDQCVECGEEKVIIGHNLCKRCYGRWYYHKNSGKQMESQKRYRQKYPEKARLSSRKYYYRNQEKCKELSRDGIKKNRKLNKEYLESIKPLKCELCGYDKCFAALEFHHSNTEQKVGRRDTSSYWLGYSPERFKEIINKVDFQILCANCHRELHNGY